MILARVEGNLIATKKNPKMTGRKLLLVRPLYVDTKEPDALKQGTSTLVAVDSLGAGDGELVLVVQGSSARSSMTEKDTPVDAAVIGIVDSIDIARKMIYRAQ